MDLSMTALVLPIEVTLGQSRVTASTVRALEERTVRFKEDAATELLRSCRRSSVSGRFRLHCRSIRSFGFETKIRLQVAYNRAQKEGLVLCEPEVIVRVLEDISMIIRPGRAAHFAMNASSSAYIFQLHGVRKTMGMERLVRLLPRDTQMEYACSTELIFCQKIS